MEYDGLVLLINQYRTTQCAHITVTPCNGDVSVAEYLKWIKYVPNGYKEIKNKKILNDREKKLLKIMKYEKRVKESFENYLSDKKTTSYEALDIYRFMEKVSLIDYAKLKLTEEELISCYSKIVEYKKGNLDKYYDIEEDNMADCFVRYYIRTFNMIKYGYGTVNDKTKDKVQNFDKDMQKVLKMKNNN